MASEIYIAQWEWTRDALGSAWDAPGGGHLGAIDLRTKAQAASPGILQGFGVFSYPGPRTILGSIHLGSDLDRAVPLIDRTAVSAALSLPEVPQPGPVRQLLWDLLTRYSDPTRQSMQKPLIPTRRGFLELHLKGFSTIKREAFDLGSHPWRDKILEVERLNYKELYDSAAALELKRRFLGDRQAKYRASDYRIFLHASTPDEGVEAPRTTIGDTFNRADGTGLNVTNDGKTVDGGAGSWSWTEVQGDHEIASNQLHNVTGNNVSYARADYDLSSDDHIARVKLVWTANGSSSAETSFAPCARFRVSQNDNYMFYRAFDSTGGESFPSRIRLRKTNNGTRTNLSSDVVNLVQNGEVIGIGVDGSTLRGYKNDVELDSISDPDHTGHTRCGVFSFRRTGTEQHYDDFAAEDVTSGANIPLSGRAISMGRARADLGARRGFASIGCPWSESKASMGARRAVASTTEARSDSRSALGARRGMASTAEAFSITWMPNLGWIQLVSRSFGLSRSAASMGVRRGLLTRAEGGAAAAATVGARRGVMSVAPARGFGGAAMGVRLAFSSVAIGRSGSTGALGMRRGLTTRTYCLALARYETPVLIITPTGLYLFVVLPAESSLLADLAESQLILE